MATELDKVIDFLYSRRRLNPDTLCWEWEGHIGPAGYAITSKHMGETLVHRLSARVFLGLGDPDARFVLHKCDNRKCFNPMHLRLGTAADNMRDMIERGRTRNGTTKLDWPKVRQIRELASAGYKYKDIAPRFGVSLAVCSNIATNKVWIDPDWEPVYRHNAHQRPASRKIQTTQLAWV